MGAEILTPPECGGELTLAGWSQHTPAFAIVDLDALLSGYDVRGDSVLVERQEGREPRARLRDETTYRLPMVFVGGVDRLGDPLVDGLGDPLSPSAGRATNLLAYRAQVVTQQVIAGQLVYDDGTTFGGDCIAEHLQVTLKPGGLALASLRLVIPKPWPEVV